MGEILYHYTNGLHISQILAERMLRVTPDFAAIRPAEPSSREEIERNPEVYGVERVRTPIGISFTFQQKVVYLDGTTTTETLNWFVGELPVVWLSAAAFCYSALVVPRFRSEARAAFALRESERLVGGFFRIAVSVGDGVFPWEDYRHRCKVPERICSALAEVTRRRGDNVQDYWFSLNPIPDSCWTAVERYESETWKSMPVDE